MSKLKMAVMGVAPFIRIVPSFRKEIFLCGIGFNLARMFINSLDDRAGFCFEGGFYEGVAWLLIRPTEQNFHTKQRTSEGARQFMKHPGKTVLWEKICIYVRLRTEAASRFGENIDRYLLFLPLVVDATDPAQANYSLPGLFTLHAETSSGTFFGLGSKPPATGITIIRKHIAVQNAVAYHNPG